MVITINIAGSIKRMKGLSRKMNKEVSHGSGEFIRAVVKSAKLRAPEDTEELSRNIVAVKTKNGWDLVVASRQGFFQEEGFKPHWIHKSQIKNTKNPRMQGKDFIFVSKSKPFVRPALEMNLSNLPNILSKSTKRALSG